MQISVLVEQVAGNGFRARGAEPFGLSAEGATREEAVAKVRQLCQDRLSGVAEVVTVEVGPPPHPWLPFAGMFKDDPDFQEVLEIMAENRRKMDDAPRQPCAGWSEAARELAASSEDQLLDGPAATEFGENGWEW